MISKGADINMVDVNGRTPLTIAAITGHKPCVRLLIDKGADAALRDKNGHTALMEAEQKGHEQIKRLLEKVTANRRQSI